MSYRQLRLGGGAGSCAYMEPTIFESSRQHVPWVVIITIIKQNWNYWLCKPLQNRKKQRARTSQFFPTHPKQNPPPGLADLRLTWNSQSLKVIEPGLVAQSAFLLAPIKTNPSNMTLSIEGSVIPLIPVPSICMSPSAIQQAFSLRPSLPHLKCMLDRSGNGGWTKLWPLNSLSNPRFPIS